MIMEVSCDVKEIKEKNEGKSYEWPRTDRCPHCSGVRIWGHGFVWAFFESVVAGLYLKRYRCPCCGCVRRMKPVGYFRGFTVTVAAIRSSVALRVECGTWLGGLSHNRQSHWLRALNRQVLAHLGISWLKRLVEGFDALVGKGIIPVSRSFKT